MKLPRSNCTLLTRNSGGFVRRKGPLRDGDAKHGNGKFLPAKQHFIHQSRPGCSMRQSGFLESTTPKPFQVDRRNCLR